jgi:chaperonin GroES
MKKVENKSGVYPVEYKVLIKPDEVNEKTKGGLYLPETTKEKESMAQVQGMIVSIGGDAFSDWKEKPVVGERVYFGKYAGYVITGKDDEQYRLVNDKDICAIIK